MKRPYPTIAFPGALHWLGLLLLCVASSACGKSDNGAAADSYDASVVGDTLPDSSLDQPTDTGDSEGGGDVPSNAFDGSSDGEVPDVESADATVDISSSDGGADSTFSDSATCWNGAACDDDDPCTFGDMCKDGVCAGKPYGCNDGRDCTQDACDGNGSCVFSVIDGFCLINNVCRAEGETAPTNDCLTCSPADSKKNWSLVPSGEPCGGNSGLCLQEGTCLKGQCSAPADDCNDGNPCTDDVCAVGEGCSHSDNFDLCEDGDPCTLWDKCADGKCMPGPQPLNCDDGNQCTDDFCTEDGCVNLPRIGPCSDGLACTIDDQCADGLCVSGEPDPCDDSNECTTNSCLEPVGCVHLSSNNPCCLGLANVCDDGDPCTVDDCSLQTGECFHEVSEGTCSDQNKCTKGDTCVDGACIGQPVDCDDGNGCTDDACDPTPGCTHTPVGGECDDKNACTQGDMCVGGKCKGMAASCNDANPCTVDSCDPKKGCLHDPKQGACDDGDKCTSGDTCVAGVCVGDKVECPSAECQFASCHPLLGCQYTSLDSVPCEDGDPCTDGDFCTAGECVPGAPICSGCDFEFSVLVHRVVEMAVTQGAAPGQALDLDGDGNPDNAFAGVAGFVNGGIQGAIDNGDVHLLLEHHGLVGTGGSYTLNAFAGQLAPDAAGCDFQSATCSFLVSPESFNLESCAPLVSFDNAKKKNGKITAGGKGYQFVCQVPIVGKGLVSLVLYNAALEAQEAAGPGKQLTGVLAGAVPKQSLLEAVPAEFQALVDMLLVNDIDTDGDGTDDAASVAFAFVANSAVIEGFAP